ncbi:MAG: CPBP family intramembrane metalloprotease [Bacilli bacterium]|nr:CPBP family intramembrane metalloprotease [Bacilli bacterium]
MNKTDLGKNCLISISVILLYFFWPTVLKAFWETFGGRTSVTLGMFIYNVVGYAILVGILVAIYYKPLKENWIKFCKDKKKIVSILKYTAILFIGVLICNSILKYVFDVGVIENEADLLVQFEKSPIWILLMVTIYYPIVEVIVFQKTIRQVIEKPWIFIFVSSIFFGYFNIAFSKITLETLLGTLPYIFLNAVLAFSYYKKDNIMVPIGTKMLYNLVVTIISFL